MQSQMTDRLSPRSRDTGPDADGYIVDHPQTDKDAVDGGQRRLWDGRHRSGSVASGHDPEPNQTDGVHLTSPSVLYALSADSAYRYFRDTFRRGKRVFLRKPHGQLTVSTARHRRAILQASVVRLRRLASP